MKKEEELNIQGIYKKIFTLSKVIQVILDKKGKILLINDFGAKFLGYKKQKLLGKNWFQLVIPKNSVKELETVHKINIKSKGKKDVNFINPILTKEGEEKTITWTNTVFKRKNKIIGTISSGIDITKQKIEEEKYKSIFEGSPEVILQLDKKGIIKEVNKRIYDIIGYKVKEVKGKSILKLPYIPIKGKAIIFKNFTKRLFGQKIDPYEIEFIHKNGKKVIGRITAKLIKDENGHVQGEHVIINDITLEKRIKKLNEEKLEKEKEKFENLVNKLPNTVVYSTLPDKEGTVLFISKTWGDWTGYYPEHFHKNRELWMKCIYPGDKKRAVKNYVKAFKKKKPYAFEYRLIHKKTGKIHYVLDQGNPIFDDKGKLLHYNGVIIDRTDLKKSEKKILEAESKYELLYETSNDAIMTLEPPTWRFTSANPATVKLFGAKNEKDFISKGPWQVSPKYQPDGKLSSIKAKKMIMKAMKEGKNFFEWTHMTLQRKNFFATVLLSRLEENGKQYLQATVRDISIEKKFQNKLLEKQILLNKILESISSGLFLVDNNGEILFFNKGYINLLNPSKNILKQKNGKYQSKKIFEFLFKQLKNKEEFLKLLKKSYNNKEKMLLYLYFKDGKILQAFSNPVIINKKVIGRIWVYNDLTQAKKYDRQISQQKLKFEKLFENLPLLAYNISLNGKIINCNKKVIEVLGYKNKKELIGKPLSFVFAPESLTKVKELFAKWKNEGKLVNEEIKIKTKKGKVIPVLLNVQTLYNSLGQPLYSISTQQDIFEIYKIRENLTKKLEELETFKRLSVGRELRMIELKKEIADLKGKYLIKTKNKKK